MKENKYKLLVVDVDGTLLNRANQISPEDVAAIKNTVSRGIKVALCTGRALQGCRWILAELGLDGYHIFSDGALVCNPFTGEEISAVAIDPALVRETARLTQENGLHYDVYSTKQFYYREADWAVELRRTFFHIEGSQADFDTVSRREKIIKCTIITRSAAERARAAKIEAHFKGKLAFSWTTTPAFPEIHFINVLDPRVNKGEALEKLAAFYKIPLAQVMAIGDGENDISLLKKAGLAVAMGDCAGELREVAHHITEDVEHCGVAEAIKRFLQEIE
ncbi:MAG: Cof-type HAD-IIB family hydrolase [Dehalococcoidales bacterium]|nr:Cof-type HAD-IIB family hydrolase [Dehalococcoidales bacterium]